MGALLGPHKPARSWKVAAMPRRPLGSPCPREAQPCLHPGLGRCEPAWLGGPRHPSTGAGVPPGWAPRAPTWLCLRPGRPRVLPHIAAPQRCAR